MTWDGCLTSLDLSLFVCKVVIIIVPDQHIIVRIKRNIFVCVYELTQTCMNKSAHNYIS